MVGSTARLAGSVCWLVSAEVTRCSACSRSKAVDCWLAAIGSPCRKTAISGPFRETCHLSPPLFFFFLFLALGAQRASTLPSASVLCLPGGHRYRAVLGNTHVRQFCRSLRAPATATLFFLCYPAFLGYIPLSWACRSGRNDVRRKRVLTGFNEIARDCFVSFIIVRLDLAKSLM